MRHFRPPTNSRPRSQEVGQTHDARRTIDTAQITIHHSAYWQKESGRSQCLAAVSNVPTQNPSPWNTHCVFLQCTCGFWRVASQHSETRQTPINLLGIFKRSEVYKSEGNACGGGNPGWCKMSDTAVFKAINLQSRLLMHSVRPPTDSWRQ